MVFVYILLILVLAALAFIIFKSRHSSVSTFSDDFFKKFNEKFPEVLNQANTNLIHLASQNLDTKKTAIEELVKHIQSELTKNQQKLETAENSRISSFATLAQKLEEQKALTQQLSATTDGLKRVLSNNQLRGAFGERIAEDLLKMTGFVRGVDYEFNKEQGSTSTRPDFAVFLPDGAKINVDAKFPYSNLQKMTETENPDQKNEHLKAFEKDVRDKIRQVTSRDYIDPENKTVDFVILFIPNEMIFSFIYDKMPSVWEEAMEKKVVFAGPFSFTAILRMVRQAYDNFRYQHNIQGIITQIKQFEKEFQSYNQEFEKIGDKITNLTDQYQKVNTTRTRQLLRSVDKIKLENPKPDQPLLPET